MSHVLGSQTPDPSMDLAQDIGRSCQNMTAACAEVSITLDASPRNRTAHHLAQTTLRDMAVELDGSIQDYATLRGRFTNECQTVSSQLDALQRDLDRVRDVPEMGEQELHALLAHALRHAVGSVSLLRWAAHY